MAKKKKKTRPKKKNGVSVVSTANVNFASPARRGSKYDKLFARVGKLKAGQSLIVPVPKGMKATMFQNRLNSALRKSSTKPPRGCSFSKRITLEGKVAISCERN